VRAGTGAAVAAAFGARVAQAQATGIRWDVTNVDPQGIPGDPRGAVPISTAGGEASAGAEDGERISLTASSGAFLPGAPRSVGGGGSYALTSAAGAATGGGTYRVTELLYWEGAPGMPNPNGIDRIGPIEAFRAGLALFRVAYADGQAGVLVVSCRILGSPSTMFEGVIASRGAGFYWNRGEPKTLPQPSANFTAFHAGQPPPPPVAAVSRGRDARRWDIISVQQIPGGMIVSAGGAAGATAEDGTRLVVTGTGTFTAAAPRAVTGGGTYRITDPRGGLLFGGAYRATELLFWEEAPGVWPATVQYRIGTYTNEDQRAGLAVLRVAYADGNPGVLVLSCRAPALTPPPVFEGVLGAHSHTCFWNHGVAQADPFVDENRTAFFVVRGPTALPATGDGSAEDERSEEG
jgi:hypothetical protein